MKSFFTAPTVAEFNDLYAAVGWGRLPEAQVAYALAHTAYAITVRADDGAVGMARLIGDGAFCYELVDVITRPDYQGQGIGKHMCQQLIDAARAAKAPSWGLAIDVFSAAGKEGFYQSLGFTLRPAGPHGAGLTLVTR